MTIDKQAGVNRLSVFVGCGLSVAWLLWFGIYALVFSELVMKPYIFGAILAFVIPFMLIQGAYWVYKGFRD